MSCREPRAGRSAASVRLTRPTRRRADYEPPTSTRVPKGAAASAITRLECCWPASRVLRTLRRVRLGWLR